MVDAGQGPAGIRGRLMQQKLRDIITTTIRASGESFQSIILQASRCEDEPDAMAVKCNCERAVELRSALQSHLIDGELIRFDYAVSPDGENGYITGRIVELRTPGPNKVLVKSKANPNGVEVSTIQSADTEFKIKIHEWELSKPAVEKANKD